MIAFKEVLIFIISTFGLCTITFALLLLIENLLKPITRRLLRWIIKFLKYY